MDRSDDRTLRGDISGLAADLERAARADALRIPGLGARYRLIARLQKQGEADLLAADLLTGTLVAIELSAAPWTCDGARARRTAAKLAAPEARARAQLVAREIGALHGCPELASLSLGGRTVAMLAWPTEAGIAGGVLG